MSKRIARGAYKMTPRRKAALKKAQAISARKRRKNRNRAIAGGVGIVAGAGIAYAGYKYRGNISAEFKKHSASVDGIVKDARTRIAHQIAPREATRKAGAVSPAAAPRHNAPKVKKPKATRGAKSMTKTTVPQIDKAEQSELMKQATKPRGPSWLDESTFNEDGTVSKNALAGISKELLTGNVITAQQAHSALAKSARAVGKPLTQKQRSAIVNAMIAEGTVSRSVNGTKARKNNSPRVTPRAWVPDEDYGFE